MDVQSAANLNIPEGSVRNIHDKDKRLLWSAVGYNVRYDGNTTQQTYAGKNLASIKTSSATVVGGLAFTIEEGTIKINGTTSQQSDAFFFDSFQTDNGVARFWVDVTGYTDEESTNAYIILQVSDDGFSWSTGVEINLKSTAQHVKNITLDSSKYYRIRFYVNNNTFTNSIIKVQLEYGTVATSFEPYVGGIPSPSPDYPQDVHVVTGEQTVKITGKNIFSFDAGTFFYNGSIAQTHTNNAAHMVATGTIGAQYVGIATRDFETSKTYCISCKAKKIVSGVDGQPILRLYIQYSDDGTTWSAQTVSSVENPAQGQEYELSATFSGHPYYRFFFYNNSSTPVTVGEESEYWNIQLEEGSTATSYEAYQSQPYTVNLGNTELCKIGVYQDYIFKSSGKNLFDGILESGLINGNTGEDMPNASYIRSKDFIPVSENTTYTLSAKDYPDAYYFWYEYKSDYTYNLTSNKTSKEGTFTTDPGTAFVRFRFTTDFTDTSTPTQLEKGFSATPYEPYGTDWYVYKETKSGIVSLGNTVYTLNGGLKGSVYAPLDRVTANGNAFCDRASVGHGSYDIWPGCFYENPANVMFVGNTTDDNVSLKTKYNGAIFYYALSTPTYTKITDNTLISQLNALRDWLIRYDYYGAVTGNLPIIINRTGLT